MFKNKGRVRVGADADLTIFNPDTVIDRSTFDEPLKAPEGILDVLVGGIAVVQNGRVQPGITPGRALRAPIRE